MSSCNICAEKFNKTNRCKVTCTCDFECCRTCIKTYILDKTEDAHCMSCKVVWDRKFMSKSFEKTFMSKAYKNHREEILMQKELGMLQIELNNSLSTQIFPLLLFCLMISVICSY